MSEAEKLEQALKQIESLRSSLEAIGLLTTISLANGKADKIEEIVSGFGDSSHALTSLKVDTTPVAWRTVSVIWGNENAARRHAAESNLRVEELGLIVRNDTEVEPAQTAESLRFKAADDMARRLLWIAFVWNDHNFDSAEIEARKEAAKHGITSLEEAVTWISAPFMPGQKAVHPQFQAAEAMAGRLLQLAFKPNADDQAPHVEARKEAARHGIRSFEEANAWLTA